MSTLALTLLLAALPVRAVEVSVDRQVELFSLALAAGDPSGYQKRFGLGHSTYSLAAWETIDKFKGSQAAADVRRLAEAWRGNEQELTRALIDPSGTRLSPEETASLVSALSRFEKEIRFDAFLHLNSGHYIEMESVSQRELDSGIPLDDLAAYAGAQAPPYRVILAPLLPADFGFSRPSTAGVLNVVVAARHDPGSQRFFLGEFGNSIDHDLAHRLLDPWFEGLKEGESSVSPPEGCADRGDAGWRGCLNEHIVDAWTLRLWQFRRGPDYAASLRRRMSGSLPYLDAVEAEFSRYEKGPRTAPHFAAALSRILAAFNKSSGADLHR